MTETGKIGIRNYRLLSMLTLGQTPSIPVVSKVPTIILGMGALFGFPEQSDMPSIAAMVSSKRWPLISGYGALGHTQSLKLKMINSFFKTISNKVDDGIMKEALLDFYKSSEKRKLDQIIIFRDGVSESQFNQVLIKLLRLGSPDNVLHGTIIDNKICHPKNNDFYLGTHAGMIGITRQTDYHLHSWGQFMKIRDASETSSSHDGMYAPEVISVPQLSKLKDKVSNFILVC
ncbi:hypothetical protein GOBAR_AA20837 [Gossypium barbadense]|uniref:Piwi domain-containing protein n=1 Tax=Gossypium barbadense TaxID=3634 RepID=A0A2P5X924_GOSBA|nr:hypothetical protein GOBAR_AA20837 [Gossypium barbadense]